MPVPTDPLQFANNTVADALEVNSRFAPLYAALDGALDHTNAVVPKVFHAYRSAALVLATNPQVIVFDAELFDTGGWFDTGNGRFTPQVAGYWRLTWRTAIGSHPASSSLMAADLHRNGVAVSVGQVTRSTAGEPQSSGGSMVVAANGSTDYFTVSLGSWVGASLAVGAAATFLCGELIGRS